MSGVELTGGQRDSTAEKIELLLWESSKLQGSM